MRAANSAIELAAEGMMMKSMKVAAALAGSLAVVGAAAPAFAAGNITPPAAPAFKAGDITPMSLNGGLDTIAQNVATASLADAQPIHTELFTPDSDGSLRHAVVGTAKSIRKTDGASSPDQLLGGLPVG
ncbi:hypothetical protein ACIBCO_32560 [Streptomyces violascens]|uniref:hypothetical protein n=1 Tax=Streptomyces violascens TaxID=67381 RepID=UPI0037A65489